ncbi:proline-rich protein 2-like [Phalacrocorax carbo]|uniref:proline-rich protein 2-like n=1 Tax=Phalacrocorax carbo TaxID=9209 RepID=UPI0031198987
MATVALQKGRRKPPGNADTPRRGRHGSPPPHRDPDPAAVPGRPAGLAHPRRARSVVLRGARVHPKFHHPSKVLQKTGSRPLKHHRPPRDKFYPHVPLRGAEPPPHAVRTSAFPRRPQHMRALCFPRSRALPTCGGGGTPPARPPRSAPPPRKPRGRQELKLVGAGRGQRRTGPGATLTRAALRGRQGAIAAPSPRRAPGRPPAEAPRRESRATGSTCHGSSQPRVPHPPPPPRARTDPDPLHRC